MQVTIHPHGHFAGLHKGTITLEANTLREALNGLKQYDGFNPKKNMRRYPAKIDGCDTTQDLDKPLESCEIHLRPAEDFEGSSSNPVTRIIIGVVLIIVGALIVIYGSFWGATPLGMAFISMGVSLVLGGLMQILFPPEIEAEPEHSTSFTYQNTTQSGTPIPVILGRARFAGHYLSYNINTEDKDIEAPDVGSAIPGWTTLEL